LGLTRFGIMIGLKVSKKAVERNKIKRRLREAIRALSPLLNLNFDVAISVLPAAKEKNLAELKNALEEGFKRLRILK